MTAVVPSSEPAAATTAVELVQVPSHADASDAPAQDRSLSDGCSLSIDSLCASLDATGPDSKPKDILRSISGRFYPGQVCAILGSSGSGKTTLLNILSGRFRPPAMSVSGSIRLFGSAVDASSSDLMSQIAFVPQFDLHWSSLTPMETLCFTMELRFPGRFTAEERVSKAESILRSVGLWAARTTPIGDAEKGTSGLSGGEKRRLSVALALLDDSPIYLLDEFVTGLDSRNSYLLMTLVKEIATQHNKTIILTIHQPISELFSMFDSILILERGSLIYHGPRQSFLPYFQRLNYKCPEHSNPLDFLFLSVLNSIEHEEELPEEREKRIDGFIESWKTLQGEYSRSHGSKLLLSDADTDSASSALLASSASRSSPAAATATATATHPVPYFSRFLTLFRRNFLLQYRNPNILIGRTIQQAFSFLFVGIMFVPLGNSFQNRLGALFYLANNGLMAALFSTQSLYYNEKPLYLREYTSGQYSRAEYYWARIIAELTSRFTFPVTPICAIIGYLIIGYQLEADKLFLFVFIMFSLDLAGSAMGFALSAFIPTAQLCLALTPMIIFPLALFTGYYLHLPSLHWALRWISYISPSRYGFQALVLNEFRGLNFCSSESLFSSSTSADCLRSDDVIDMLGFNENQAIYGESLIQFGFTALFLILGAIGFTKLTSNITAGK